MTVRTQTRRTGYYELTDEDIITLVNLGGVLTDVDHDTEADNTKVITRSWPSIESAQAWLDYTRTIDDMRTGEILQD